MLNGLSIVKRSQLNDGDVIQIGKNELHFSQPSGSPSAALKHAQGPASRGDLLYALVNDFVTVGNYHKGDATLGVLDDSIEPKHLQISYQDRVYLVEPIAEMSVNEKPEPSAVEIREGMTIQIGKVNIRPVGISKE